MIYVNIAYMVSQNSYTSLIKINKFKFHDYSLKEIYVPNRVRLTKYKQLYQLNKTPKVLSELQGQTYSYKCLLMGCLSAGKNPFISMLAPHTSQCTQTKYICKCANTHL